MGKFNKILLVIPPNNFITKDYLPSLGILYIAALLKENNFNIIILDCPFENFNNNDAINFINKGSFDLVGITAVSDTRFNALKIISKIKNDVKIVIGGVHFTFCDINILKKYTNIYCAVRYEGEKAFLEICNGNKLENIKGISYRNNKGKIIQNPDSELINLEELPWPARELVPIRKYHAKLEGEYSLICTSIITSRGCPNNCVFCANKSFWKQKLRLRKPRDVVNEIESIINNYEIRAFDIWDDTFTVSKKHVIAICQEILKRKLRIKFYARIRVNTVDKELLHILKEAGCVAISFGVESGSPRILHEIKKDITVKQVIKVARLSHQFKFYTKAFFMINLPKEKFYDVILTFQLANYLQEKYNIKTSIAITKVYPGTDLEYNMIKRRKIKSDFCWDGYNQRDYNILHKFLNRKTLALSSDTLYYKNLNLLFLRLLFYIYFRIYQRIKRKIQKKH